MTRMDFVFFYNSVIRIATWGEKILWLWKHSAADKKNPKTVMNCIWFCTIYKYKQGIHEQIIFTENMDFFWGGDSNRLLPLCVKIVYVWTKACYDIKLGKGGKKNILPWKPISLCFCMIWYSVHLKTWKGYYCRQASMHNRQIYFWKRSCHTSAGRVGFSSNDIKRFFDSSLFFFNSTLLHTSFMLHFLNKKIEQNVF